jgi:hypothetical protein
VPSVLFQNIGILRILWTRAPNYSRRPAIWKSSAAVIHKKGPRTGGGSGADNCCKCLRFVKPRRQLHFTVTVWSVERNGGGVYGEVGVKGGVPSLPTHSDPHTPIFDLQFPATSASRAVIRSELPRSREAVTCRPERLNPRVWTARSCVSAHRDT